MAFNSKSHLSDEPVMDQNGEELKEEKMKASRQTTVMLKEEPRERGPEEGNGHRGDHDAAIDGNADSKGTMKQRQLPLEKVTFSPFKNYFFYRTMSLKMHPSISK